MTPAASPASGYVPIARGVHPLARPELDVGPLDPARHLANLSVVFKLSPQQLRERDALLAAQLDPGSPSYHQWLTPAQYAARFGANPDDIARTTAWLAQQGLEVHDVSPLGARVTFSGTVGAIEAAFHAEMRLYRVGGETHFAMSTAPSVPAGLSNVVLGILGTHDFYPHHVRPGLASVRPQYACPAGDNDCEGDGLGPADWATVYDVSPLYSAATPITGTGVNIMIVGLTEIAQTDINAFRTRFGLPASTVTMKLVPNTGNAQGGNGAGIEAILDNEWSGGIAPAANIYYVYNGASDENVSDAAYYAIEQNYGSILSESFAGCEEGSTASEADVLGVYGSAANLLGITYVAASGDDGAAACENFGVGGLYVNMPASFPGVTAVGGTEFLTGNITYSGGAATGYGTKEQVWNDSETATAPVGGGGGISIVFDRPSYQLGANVPTCTMVGNFPVTGITAGNMREVPDLSFTASADDNGYFIECTFNGQDCTATGGNPVVIQIGGTSASTPSFAGVLALVTQATGGGRLGNVNPMLYALQASKPSAFHDITLGSNEVKCTGADPGCGAGGLYGYAAATGYDCGSGLGSLDVANFVGAWQALAPTSTTLTASPTATTEGGSVQLTADVSVSGTHPSNLGGTVTFAFQSYLSNGQVDLAWTLGTANITNGTPTGGSVAPSFVIPPGMVDPTDQAVDVVAMYGGDANHLASTSATVHITFSSPITLCVVPTTDTVKAGADIAFAAEGGVSPYQWFIDYDSTCNAQGNDCSTLNQNSGAFVAGTGAAGYVLVQLLDADGAETFSEITVDAANGKAPTGTAPWASGSGILTNGPITACPTGDDCGTIPNGCGATVSCGAACTSPETCGGGGTANVCGCTPTVTSCPAGDDCGTVSNGCGGTVSCGPACTSPQTCGGGGTANVCGCTPLKACPAGDSCGTVADGCGGTVACGVCSGSDVCSGNVCVPGSTQDAGSGSDAGSGGQDAGTGSDSGTTATDSGTTGNDSGTTTADSGTMSDAGSTEDAGEPEDAGSTEDASAADSSTTADAATAHDASTPSLDASLDGAFDAGASGFGAPAGCGCKTAGEAPGSPRTASLGALALLIGITLRRRRR